MAFHIRARDLFYKMTTESDTRDGYQERKTVQKLVLEWDVYISIAQGVPLILSNMLFSPLSDSIGRRPFLFAGSLGICVKQLRMTLAIFFHWDIYLFIPFALVEGFSGSWFAQLAIAMTVVSDLTKAGKSRSYLITVFSFTLYVQCWIFFGNI
ncbi:proton-coupled folate transporter-like [Saccostrea cucullata]|uniref:proton-coupled folate transporter-like n=1 Tax=Saccostrea cuccullata TaxID=36930 RepID=UPI002ED6187D